MVELRELLGVSPAIERLRATIRNVVRGSAAATRPPAVLITGETGTGKGLVARLLHRLSPRASGPFVDVNCASIPDTLLEAELFGFERGAFTDARRPKAGLFQTAHGGTIFLDEVGLLNEALQAKLLTVIEERVVRRLGSTRTEAVDASIISATNADLSAAIRERRFREDLYHRLAVVTLEVPPLRDRDGDVVLLAEHFLSRACRDYGLPPHVLSADARRRLLDHAWRGNVRELANVMERAALLAGSTEVTAVTLNLPPSAPPAPPGPPVTPAAVTAGTSLDEVMRAHMQNVLDRHGGNISRASSALGVSRNTVLKEVWLRGGRRQPVVLAIEDLHWIDDSSEAVLTAVAEALAASHELLLVTYRPGFTPPWTGRSYASQIALARLSKDESLAVLQTVVPGAVIAEDLAERIAGRAEGVPFFLEKLARATLEARPTGGTTPDAAGAEMPETIEGVLVTRLQRLPADDLDVLQVAAVGGQDVRVPILAAAAGRSEAEIQPSLGRLQAAEFVRLVLDDLGVGYAFKHALTHEVAYRSVPEPRRKSLHAATAATLERLAPDIAERRPEILAHHFTEADRPDAALPYWLRAGQLAVQHSANVEAIAHLSRGLSLVNRLPVGQPWIQQELMLRLTLTRAQAAHHGYAADQVGTNLTRVRVIADELGESPDLMPVRYGLWLFYLSRAQLDAANELADRMLAAARRQPPGPLDVAANVAGGVSRFYLGDLVGARERLEQAVALHKPEYAPIQAAAYGQDLGVGGAGYLGWVLALAGEPDRALAMVERALGDVRRGRHASRSRSPCSRWGWWPVSGANPAAPLPPARNSCRSRASRASASSSRWAWDSAGGRRSPKTIARGVWLSCARVWTATVRPASASACAWVSSSPRRWLTADDSTRRSPSSRRAWRTPRRPAIGRC